MGAELFHADAPKNLRKLNYLYSHVGVVITSGDRRNQHKTDLNFFLLFGHDESVEGIKSFLFVPKSRMAIVATVRPFNMH